MAIQLPNPGLGDGQTGDNEFVMWTKVKDNFSNTTHAASRLVGLGNSDLVQASDVSKAFYATAGAGLSTNGNTDLLSAPRGVYSGGWRGNPYSPKDETWGVVTSDTVGVIEIPYPYQGNDSARRMWAYGASGDVYYFNNSSGRKWAKLYTTENTTKDTATGFLKASSPVLHVYNDSITKIHEAEQLDITVDKKGVGHYEIHGTTGLRKNDGWFMSPPRDVHGNVLCMVDLEEKDGVVILKTYKKKFDFETVSIVHDYENPMDIPDGVCVEFRFNDLPQEQLDEPIE